MIILMAGLPGTGKTTLARELALRLNGRVLSKDEFRHSIFDPGEIEYSTRQDDFCQQLMLATAGFLFSRDPTKYIFLDGRPFSRRYQIENVIGAAASLHQPWRILECVCPEGIARERLESAARKREHPAGNRDFQLYLDVKSRFEVIFHPKITIECSQPIQDCVEQAIRSFAIPAN